MLFCSQSEVVVVVVVVVTKALYKCQSLVVSLAVPLG